MTLWQRKSKRKLTGGRLKKNAKKKKRERGRDFVPTKIEKRKIRKIRVTGGNVKISLLSENFANITVGKETKRAKILSVIENYANPHLTRQNVITKGCIIETELGKARVTSRPGQHGIINAVLLGEK
ncbi:MAG: 30S ribosomal protein S8e [Candidatus Aenigmarchaeota archaeon]|nr:30S ribosomal protein S8e [Candidatus Aenigmarchaeota archaeon]